MTTTTTPTTTTGDAHGPVDFVLIEFPRDRLTGGAARALLDLVDRGTVRIYDLVVIDKGPQGEVTTVPVDGAAPGGERFADFAGARSGLLDDEDVQAAAAAMRAGTVAALLVYENSWAIPFVTAVRGSGGELVASARIPAADVLAAVEAAETTG